MEGWGEWEAGMRRGGIGGRDEKMGNGILQLMLFLREYNIEVSFNRLIRAD